MTSTKNWRPAVCYCDGGVIGRNPSRLGGTWAVVGLDESGEVLFEESGLVLPNTGDVGDVITNNLTELYAAIKAMEFLHPGTPAQLYTDSLVTLRRITRSYKFAGIPIPMRDRCLFLRRDRKFEATLVGGHPTKKELEQGFRKRNGLPVSIWNKKCDDLCREQALTFQGKGESP